MSTSSFIWALALSLDWSTLEQWMIAFRRFGRWQSHCSSKGLSEASSFPEWFELSPLFPPINQNIQWCSFQKLCFRPISSISSFLIPPFLPSFPFPFLAGLLVHLGSFDPNNPVPKWNNSPGTAKKNPRFHLQSSNLLVPLYAMNNL